MQVEYQNKKESPFDTHPLQKNTFLITICIYGALLGIMINTKTRRGYLEKIFRYGLLLSGAFSSLSLLSILMQQKLLWIVLVIWGSIPLILSHHMLRSAACWTVKIFSKLTWDVSDKHSSACGNNDVCPRVEGI
ncbi:hypothetical protein VIGAN_UM129800 [Vigna angularis var. angularis]|uniref:Uncharacterized protein n=1 Tax=Vigna angularis var. angularis TaxID=157739 RepID=A0A0S3TEM9_PHAAN|nr:hypothetical protein VIGAN_09115600 [Vigna angularis var. angularis]BAU03480.1 hypothetical protein VIGAN_UM113600 [Vigna angularis var. angularis]BAU03563.1 hypothetical protein VIGAN_UM129800 [Vigna angularis var. angularis]